MRFSIKNSPLLLLALPALTTALVVPGSEVGSGAASTLDDDAAGFVSSRNTDDSSLAKARPGLPTKDAPVDGKDGKPHSGPFVETDSTISTGGELDGEALRPLKGRPNDPTMVDGKKIPESNDGVMFDKNREKAKEGTTGTEGGVSEKDKVRKAQEGMTGEKAVTQPESPKEKPPMPHSEEAKLGKTDKTYATEKDTEGSSEQYTGLDVRLAFDPTSRRLHVLTWLTKNRDPMTFPTRRAKSLLCLTPPTRTISMEKPAVRPRLLPSRQSKKRGRTMRALSSLSTPLSCRSP
jgi:hypothetical protein